MKQKDLVRELYQACCERDQQKIRELRAEEFRKIFKRRDQGRAVCTPRWTLVRI